ncbi:MAG: hypothetical protein M1372_00020 [Patescibacteria group bacterium]|nr:hypothetical protein [Patescibacteria group bacterium]
MNKREGNIIEFPDQRPARGSIPQFIKREMPVYESPITYDIQDIEAIWRTIQHPLIFERGQWRLMDDPPYFRIGPYTVDPITAPFLYLPKGEGYIGLDLAIALPESSIIRQNSSGGFRGKFRRALRKFVDEELETGDFNTDVMDIRRVIRPKGFFDSLFHGNEILENERVANIYPRGHFNFDFPRPGNILQLQAGLETGLNIAIVYATELLRRERILIPTTRIVIGDPNKFVDDDNPITPGGKEHMRKEAIARAVLDKY